MEEYEASTSSVSLRECQGAGLVCDYRLMDIRNWRGDRYVSAANPSTTRQIYSVEIPRDKTAIEAVRRLAMTVNNVSELAESGVVALTPWHPDGKLEVKDGQDDKSGYYRANFSPGAGWYVLDYDGPGVPWQRLVKVGDPSQSQLF